MYKDGKLWGNTFWRTLFKCSLSAVAIVDRSAQWIYPARC